MIASTRRATVPGLRQKRQSEIYHVSDPDIAELPERTRPGESEGCAKRWMDANGVDKPDPVACNARWSPQKLQAVTENLATA